jgi:hypothetical protein
VRSCTDADGHRVTGFLTNSSGDDPAALELRHRRHARVEDRIRAAKETGLANLPFHNAAATPSMARDRVFWPLQTATSRQPG